MYAGATARGAVRGTERMPAGLSVPGSAAEAALGSAGGMVGAASAAVAAAAVAAAARATGAGGATSGMGTVAGPAAHRVSIGAEVPGGASSTGSCGCAAATADAEKRIMKKLCDIVKKTAEDRKNDEKVNKVMRQEVTAIADEVKSIKKKTGKLVAGLDTAKGDVKRTSEGLEELNKILTLNGPGNGTAGTGLGAAAQTAATVGGTQLSFFSGPPQKATWVKPMVVRA